ncbi:uncharacterized protein N7469_001208 [Penicillium citrinum]|uniref:CBF1-interacting co-repressor CIR N-terminal domain-containing protein n=1 Tax=Penicillium citrinum TaxID=5077 RepID=A0A9W9PEC9_PENCI|nr:uncharacterized protein N7469_001208 [Penicillium citrinum]KAJ5242881.1 hypothetical protein N7469_001208 [Penicillium citrinum]
MGGGDLNLKKSWHPSLLRNQERVWQQEKQALEERKRIDQNPPASPDSIIELIGCTKPPSSATGQYTEEMEGYLLGKRRIDGILLKKDTDSQNLEKGADVVGAHAAAAAGPSVGSQRDTMSKVMADPLLEIRKREQAAQEAAMKEAIRRKEREEKRGARNGDRDRERRHRDRDRDHDSKRRRYSDDVEDERRHRHSRRSHRHRSRSPASPERSSRRHRSERDNDEDRDRRRNDRTRDRSRDRQDYRERHPRSDYRRDRDDRRDRDRDHDRSSGRDRDRDRSPKRSNDREYSPHEKNGRNSRENDRQNDRRGRDFNNHRNGSYGRDRAPPSRPAQNKPDPKELEEERQRKLAEMQSNANDMENDRLKRITEITAKEEEQREADDRQRSDRGRFMSQVHKRVGEDSLDERIRRSRGGLSKMEEE